MFIMEVLCRFQDKCKNEICAYAHLTDLKKSSLCKFGNKCNKMNVCKFLHPEDLKIKRKLCQYQDKCPHDECRYVHLDNLYRCLTCSKLVWTTTEVLTDKFMIELIKESGSEGHQKKLRCEFQHEADKDNLLSEQSQNSISETDTDTDASCDSSHIDIIRLLPPTISLKELLLIRTDLDKYISNRWYRGHNVINN